MKMSRCKGSTVLNSRVHLVNSPLTTKSKREKRARAQRTVENMSVNFKFQVAGDNLNVFPYAAHNMNTVQCNNVSN